MIEVALVLVPFAFVLALIIWRTPSDDFRSL